MEKVFKLNNKIAIVLDEHCLTVRINQTLSTYTVFKVLNDNKVYKLVKTPQGIILNYSIFSVDSLVKDDIAGYIIIGSNSAAAISTEEFKRYNNWYKNAFK